MRNSTRQPIPADPQTNHQPVTEPTPPADDTSFNPATLERQPTQAEPAEAAKSPEDAAPDPFDPVTLRVTDPLADIAQKAPPEVMARKPGNSWFVRTHPDPAYSLATYLIELKDERESYLLAPSLRSALAGEATLKLKLLITAVNRQGLLFLWELSLPGPDGKVPGYISRPLDAADRAKTKWVRIAWSQTHNFHEIVTAIGDLPEPEWPTLTFPEILKLAFKGRYIDTLTHPILRRLRGEV